jgi:glycosyltransferase involved in cell wall biosynthesis
MSGSPAQVPMASVIVPTHDRLEHLRVAVDCVRAQTLSDWELVIADDGSGTETRDYLLGLASDARIRVLLLPRSGNPSRARNAAIHAARGHHLAFLDSDDTWEPHKLERQLAIMRAAPARRWSYTQVRRIDDHGAEASSEGVRPWRAFEGAVVERLLRLEALVAMPSVIAERALVLEAGAFDEQQRYCEDYDLWLRLAVRSEVTAIAEPLACVRVHARNYSQDRAGVHASWVRLYRKHAALLRDPRQRALCRRRAAESALVLASAHAAAGRRVAALRALGSVAAHAWWRPAWWRRGARALWRRAARAP